ncbi:MULTISPECIES: peptidoglycan DD-metalloendopeptidase family protein [Paraburkholderia]|uniref:peptidoglycan DD-metalloendopeptidase family protein n=1 Tax=Paraburkholderia TaxID=1822464 RepID=UPI00225681F3|nr:MULTISPECIES: peptidoglycan DD-metalloendopeptidase family protein [Paraburkholderia]MCX4165169.1 peptidoglycan DD-metalloendopeptidase family protein [Paraburkholderia megapolitana]MDN7160661.1 peptidoglycan DD-metalloendopeptidase family protein [Paraburkholderia sp. CHISQ3]MDQ6497708.1 peptidoglycan DD-metalloendopeptidase family protein [Paraburkholderia megapolitana]
MSMLRAMQTTSLNVRLTLAQRTVCVVALSLLTACATRLDQAPVVDRSGALATQAAQPAVPLGPPPPGYYRVKPGDTLYRIALENGQNYRDIATWNNLANPNQIEVDQLLRVAPPGANVAGVTPGVATAPVTGGSVQSAPLGSTGAAATGAAAGVMPAPPLYSSDSGATATVPPAGTGAGASDAAASGGPIVFAWPARGPILGTFDDAKNKGVNIGGAAGDAVTAAADGRVVYAGNGLRGYGNLIIIKHDATYLTAYAHNRALMVKEGDAVTKGQKIAEMGNSDSDRVMLHFEVRRQGKPVDPLKYLPPQ